MHWNFEQLVEGNSSRYIANQLNPHGTPNARSSTRAVSAIVGSNVRGLGILDIELYIGRHIWNRSQWIKDPDTGARRRVERPRHEWIGREDETLRIIVQELWERVKARTTSTPNAGRRGAAHRTPFGGLMTCGKCGGPIVSIKTHRYGCSIHKDLGNTVCGNSRTLPREMLDIRLITEVRDQLLQPGPLMVVRAEAADGPAHSHCTRVHH